jgi:hypothetical protein
MTKYIDIENIVNMIQKLKKTQIDLNDYYWKLKDNMDDLRKERNQIMGKINFIGEHIEELKELINNNSLIHQQNINNSYSCDTCEYEDANEDAKVCSRCSNRDGLYNNWKEKE